MKSGDKAVKGKGRHPNCVAARKKYEFKKGGPVPKGGRPQGSLSLREHIKQFLDIEIPMKMPDGTIKDKTVLHSIIGALLNKAQKGDVRAIQETLDRGFGKEPEKIEVEDKELRGTVEEIKNAVELLSKHERDF